MMRQRDGIPLFSCFFFKYILKIYVKHASILFRLELSVLSFERNVIKIPLRLNIERIRGNKWEILPKWELQN